jgi:hypothetical protein
MEQKFGLGNKPKLLGTNILSTEQNMTTKEGK